MGSSLTATDAETLSTFNNPAALGYLSHREISFTFRDFPKSVSNVSDIYGDRLSTSTAYGPSSFSSFGVAFPVSRKQNRGTIGLSYNVGGWEDDTGEAQGSLTYASGASLVAQNYFDKHFAKTDYFSVGYGRTNAAQTLSVGLSMTYATQYVEFERSYDVYDDSGSTPEYLSSEDTGYQSGTESGVGLIAGVELIPAKAANVSVGASLRTPIRLNGDGDAESLYGTIPGRLLVGVGYRTPGLRGRNDDYVVWGAQLEQFYGGSGSDLFSQTNESVGDFGAEYGLNAGSCRIPIRLGYRAAPSSGSGTRDRNEFTYGIGLRDKDARFGVDFNWSQPAGGVQDFSLTATYRFKNS